MKEITLREERFCDAYIENGGNKLAAFEEVYGYGPNLTGYSTNVDRVMARPLVFLRLLEMRCGLREQTEDKRERVIEELHSVAIANIADYVEQNDNDGVVLKDINQLTREQTRAIQEIIVAKEASGRTVTRLKFYSKIEAANSLSKICGWSNDVNLTQNNFVIRAPAPMATSAEWEASVRTLELEPQPQAVALEPSDKRGV